MGRQREQEEIVEEQEGMIDLLELMQDFFRLLRQYWWAVLLCIVCVTAVYGGVSYIGYTPMYECKATFTVGTGDEAGGSYNFHYSSGTAEQLSNTFPYILNSEYFRSVLTEKLDTNTLNGTISASTTPQSNVVTMRVESSTAEDALSILNAALEVYPVTAKFVLGELQFHMIDNPEFPGMPYNRPVPQKILLYGCAIGAALAFVILGILSLLRKNVKTVEDMKSITSLKCLTAIPQVKMKARKSGKRTRLSAVEKRGQESFVESMRALELRVEREMLKKKAKVLMVTSTAPGEGKSMVAMNLAEMYAQKGKKVLFIDGDLRKQEDAKSLGVENSRGLQEYLEEKEECVSVTRLKQQGFWFVGGSEPVINPAGTLTNLGLKEFITRQREQMDYIIIDTPSCGKFQDAALIEEYVDAVLYVVKYDFVLKQKILEGFSLLENEEAEFLGYVFNCFPLSMNYYGYGRYGYGKYGYREYGYGAGKYKIAETEKREKRND